MTNTVSTGFACQPLAGGNVLIEFYGDTGETISAVLVSANLLCHLPLLVRIPWRSWTRVA